MKAATTFLALSSLYSANAFVLQTPKDVMGPLHAEAYMNQLKTGSPAVGTPPQIGRAPPAPFGAPKATSRKSTKEVFEEVTPVKVQGGTLKTCSFSEAVSRVSVLMKTTGRPLNANVDLWQGPDNSPQKMSVYLEDGNLRPFRAIIDTPGSSNAIAIRNTGQMEFPLTAGLVCDMSENAPPLLSPETASRIVQGGAVFTTPFPPAVQSVQVALKTDGRPLNARIELLQGPNNNKQVMEVYTEDGQERPFYAIVDTPGSGNVVRIVNTATVEFPLNASVEPHIVDNSVEEEAMANGGMTWS